MTWPAGCARPGSRPHPAHTLADGQPSPGHPCAAHIDHSGTGTTASPLIAPASRRILRQAARPVSERAVAPPSDSPARRIADLVRTHDTAVATRRCAQISQLGVRAGRAQTTSSPYARGSARRKPSVKDRRAVGRQSLPGLPAPAVVLLTPVLALEVVLVQAVMVMSCLRTECARRDADPVAS